MPFAFARIAAVLFAAIALPALALAATIGGAYYAPQYDYRDLWAATDGKPSRRVVEAAVARRGGAHLQVVVNARGG